MSRRREPEWQAQSLEQVLLAVRPFVIPLAIDAVRIESPGWLQVVGNLNPLKVIADFVSKWRAENTRRLAVQVNANVERERSRTHAAIEHERIRTEFALEILRSLPTSERGPIMAERISEVIAYAVEPTTKLLEGIINDSRVLDAEVLEPGAQLPPSSQRKRPSKRGPR